MGCDVAEKLDLCSIMQVFKREVGGKQHLYIFGRHWLPAATIEQSSNPAYEGWAREGYLQRSFGATNDFDVIEKELKALANDYDVRHIAYDPWNMKQMGDHLLADGAPMVKFRPTVEHFSPALKELLALIAERRIHHNGDPVLAWAISNVVGHYDANENVFPRKERQENKIDPVTALIMALGMAALIKAKKKFWAVTSSESTPKERVAERITNNGRKTGIIGLPAWMNEG